MTNTNPSGAGSLYDAVDQAGDNGASPDTITFAPNVTGTINLPSNDLNVSHPLVVDGPGAGVLTVKSQPGDRVFDFTATGPSTSLEVEGLTLDGTETTVGGVIEASSGAPRDCGVVLTGSVITGASATNEDSLIASDNCNLTVRDTTISGGSAQGHGGGIYFEDPAGSSEGRLVVERSTIVQNHADDDGGGIFVQDDQAGTEPQVSVADSKILSNDAGAFGAGINVNGVDGDVRIERTVISGNTAGNLGGGLYFGFGEGLTVDSATMAENAANGGGGIFTYAHRGALAIRNTTLTRNRARSNGGAISSINYYDRPAAITNSTIVANYAGGMDDDNGGAIFRYGFDGVGAGFEGPDNLVLSSSVVATNQYSSVFLTQGPLASGSFQVGHSLIGSTAGGAAITESPAGTNKLNVGDPGLAPIADNGGPTPTMLPIASSPLLDAGTANGLTTDQRGHDRTADQAAADASSSDGTDIGAVELDDTQLVAGDARAKRKQKQRAKKIVVTVKASAGESATATATGTVKIGKKKLPLGEASAPVGPGATSAMKLKPASRKAKGKIAKALKKRKKAKASVSVDFSDQAGNVAEDSVQVILVGKKKKKGK